MRRNFIIHLRVRDDVFDLDCGLDRLAQMRLTEPLTGTDLCVTSAAPLDPDPVKLCFDIVCDKVKELLQEETK